MVALTTGVTATMNSNVYLASYNLSLRDLPGRGPGGALTSNRLSDRRVAHGNHLRRRMGVKSSRRASIAATKMRSRDACAGIRSAVSIRSSASAKA